MYYYEVAPNRIVRAGSTSFTYSSERVLSVGRIVSIEVGKKQLVGVVISQTTEPSYAVKPVTAVLEERPIPESLVQLALWLADYYRTPLATVLQTLLPSGLGKKRRGSYQASHQSVRNRTKIVFNNAQVAAIDAITSGENGTYILQGVTGSGKTEVYKEVARRAVDAGKSVIMLVPEISLTSQLVSEFSIDFPDMIVTHSQMTEAERHLAWREALNSPTPRVVIGPRSALFMPVPRLGAILIDEAHEPSYKQEQSPRYSALRAAGVLGKLSDAPVVLGSATPLVTDRYLAEFAGRPVLRLDERARSGAKAAQIELIDMTKRQNFSKHRFISDRLIASIEKNLASGKQTLVFHNRRGSASTTLCENCGWTALCPNCIVPLVLHGDTFSLSCHICGHQEKVPTACPVCHATEIIHKGIGTKLVESELRKLFPKARVARFDSDNRADETVNSQYQALYDGDIDIAIGTQVVAKGLDLPHLRTVGVIQADSGLSLPDYAAAERTFQLLAQVIGRVGRDEHASEVIVQSFQPSHPIIGYGLKQDYEGLYTYMIEERRRAQFPPFRYLLKLTNAYKTEAAAVRSAKELARTLRDAVHSDVRILGPTPAFYERGRDSYRWQLVLKSPKREHLVDALAHLPPAYWQAELDPSSLL
jgi:primosomal protein N' (replication factor Y)